jgi:hypothetical protein
MPGAKHRPIRIGTRASTFALAQAERLSPGSVSVTI